MLPMMLLSFVSGLISAVWGGNILTTHPRRGIAMGMCGSVLIGLSMFAASELGAGYDF
ncbi:hypothetical protein AA15237_2003 [Komagataeibacter xylinus NBRC 15237]|nr:hypothetical protein AA15237_2003 [Komagataeibacter xylinus NBRC 15237]